MVAVNVRLNAGVNVGVRGRVSVSVSGFRHHVHVGMVVEQVAALVSTGAVNGPIITANVSGFGVYDWRSGGMLLIGLAFCVNCVMRERGKEQGRRETKQGTAGRGITRGKEMKRDEER